MNNVSDNVEKSKLLYFVQKIFTENRTVYEIIWKNNNTSGQITDENILERGKDANCMPDN
jgi:hypothetical protein